MSQVYYCPNEALTLPAGSERRRNPADGVPPDHHSMLRVGLRSPFCLRQQGVHFLADVHAYQMSGSDDLSLAVISYLCRTLAFKKMC
jgi:hypothetical protein